MPADLSMFANSADIRRYPDGHVFFRQGEIRDVAYVVLSGEVEIDLQEKPIARIGPGGIFGEMALIDHRERSAGARAIGEVEAASIDQAQFLYLIRTHPTFSIEVMSVFAERLRAVNQSMYS
jgi:CRP/FNR family transcriptional regulator, cyclic AMP receptor protein